MNISHLLSRAIGSIVASWLVLAAAAMGSPITFTGSSGNRAASVTFDMQGTSLLVHLANTSKADCLVPSDVLTGFFFDIQGNLALKPLSALVSSGSTVYKNGKKVTSGIQAGPNVGGEWAYKIGLTKTPRNDTEGISSTGLNIFGPPDLFPGANLDGPTSPAGLNYGLLSAGDLLSTGNTGLMKEYLIQNAVDFVLTGLPTKFDLGSISNIAFQYGTDLSEGYVSGSPTAVPEPTGLALIAMAAAPLLGRWRKPLPSQTC